MGTDLAYAALAAIAPVTCADGLLFSGNERGRLRTSLRYFAENGYCTVV
jgi:hypothetical protein